MDLDDRDHNLIAALRDGLAPCARPYAVLGAAIGLSEADVLSRIRRMIDHGVIRRFGAIVHHDKAGYRANAMCVFDVPDSWVAEIGRMLGKQDAVTLCYRRTRRLPHWRYNLYCMIHGKDRNTVEATVHHLRQSLCIGGFPHAILFSRRRFKQCAGHYGTPATTALTADAALLTAGNAS